jgi:hypothetical protein
MMTQLCRSGTTIAESYEEAKVLFNLAKSASFGGDSHTWQSFDGRELGPPTQKIFDLRCHAECDLMNIVKPSHPHRGAQGSGKDEKTTPSLEHCMRAILHNDQLRVAFRLFEVDHAL